MVAGHAELACDSSVSAAAADRVAAGEGRVTGHVLKLTAVNHATRRLQSAAPLIVRPAS